jgi:hypothetical protein
MRTRGRIAMLIAAVLLSGSVAHAEPKPRRWYKDWKWWVGEALIAGIRVADAHSSVTVRSRCPGCYETNFLLGKHPSTGALVAMSSAGLGVETTLHILSWKYCRNEDSRLWRAVSYSLVPAITAVSIPGIVHNYGLTSQPKPAPISSTAIGQIQLVRPMQTERDVLILKPHRDFGKPVFFCPKQFSGCGHSLALCIPYPSNRPSSHIELSSVLFR